MYGIVIIRLLKLISNIELKMILPVLSFKKKVELKVRKFVPKNR